MDLEIKNSETYLRSLPTKGGFEVPEDYFEQFEINNLDESELTMDFGDSSNSFAAPVGYFEQLDAQILGKIAKKEKRLFTLNRKEIVYWISGIAATLVMVSFLFLVENKTQIHGDVEQDLSADEIAEQLSLADVNADLLCDAGWCNELEKLNKDSDNSIETLVETDEELIIDEL